VLDSGVRDGGTFVAETNEDASCGFESFELRRNPVDLFVVLDRSGSMKDDSKGDSANPDAGRPSKWSQVIPALTEVIRGAAATVAWGLKTFPEDVPGSSSDCESASVTTAIDVPISPMNATQTADAIEATSPEGNGTPTAAAIEVATGYLTGLATDDRKFILLATDGEPSCGGSAGSLVKSSSTAKTDAIAAVKSAASANLHTFVIGVATTKSSATSTLNDLATAGMEPRADPGGTGTKFYLATTESELVTALRSIVMPIAHSCVFSLTRTPPDPLNIAVKIGGAKAPLDSGHDDGWDYTDGNHTQVQVYGSWCDKVTQDARMVEIVYGCPGAVIP
jgi:von Willebrand factor type A domain